MGIRHLFFILIIGLGIQGQAQDKVIHDGEACYLHVVEKGNTLYGISKQYAASITSLLEANPEAIAGLSIGQKVFIPISEINRKQARKSPELEGNILIHKVARKETLYSLSKKYRMDINAILEANPGLEERGLKKGDTIQIPSSAAKVDKGFRIPAAKDSLLHHEVIPGETLYSLSKNYEVSIDSIKSVNGGLSEGLRAGMTLRIPKYITGFSPSTERSKSTPDTARSNLVKDPRLHMNLGLLLPFSVSNSDSSGTSMSRGSDDIMKLTDIAYEFYRGVRMGLEELSDFGLSAEVVVKDVTDSRISADKALVSNDLENLDLIIGPLHKESFEHISKNGSLADVFRVSPLSGSINMRSSKDERMSKMRASDKEMVRNLARYVQKAHRGENIVLLSGDIRSWHRELKELWPSDTTGKFQLDSLKVLHWDKENKSKLVNILDKEGKNVIIFPIEHRPSITDLISNLAMTDFRDLDITLYGLESWMNYDNLDVDVLERVKLHLPSSTFIDWEEERTVDFIKKYSDEYNTIPSANGYAFIAYDLTKYYVEGMMMYGPSFVDNQDKVNKEGLCSGFRMARVEGGGWVNQFTYMLRYEDYEFKRLH